MGIEAFSCFNIFIDSLPFSFLDSLGSKARNGNILFVVAPPKKPTQETFICSCGKLCDKMW